MAWKREKPATAPAMQSNEHIETLSSSKLKPKSIKKDTNKTNEEFPKSNNSSFLCILI